VKALDVMTRMYLSPEKLDESIAFYEHLFGVPTTLRFQYSEAHLELARE
jgi:hypothetical protein